MNHKGSVEELVVTLKENVPADYVRIVKDVSLSKQDVASYITWEEGAYTRNCIARTDNFELILICWDSGIVTPIHDHDAQKCWIYHVDGVLYEKRYKENDKGELVVSRKMKFVPGNLSYMDDAMGFHSLETKENERAISLHLYALPIDSCQVYCEDKEGFKRKKLSYHTF